MTISNKQLIEDGWVWIPAAGWTVESLGNCRWARCGAPAVAFLMRDHYYKGLNSPVSWRYCADHLYGNKIHDGQVMRYCHPATEASHKARERLA